MRVLLIADAGDGLLDLGLRAQAVGHKVRWFLRKWDARTRPVGDGLLDRVDNWRAHMDWCDLAILEANGAYMSEMDAWRTRGCLIIGGNAESASWELDRTKGMSVFKKAGIPVPAYREFTDYDAAIRHVERHGAPMYSKPCSDTADKSLSAKTGIPEDPSWTLRKWKEKHTRPPYPFLLQEAISGVEYAVGSWFGPAGFAHGFEENFEFKKLFPGDLGQNCGEAGTVMRYVARSKLAERVILPVEPQLHQLGYVGNIDVNCIVDEDGVAWPLEWTMRLGWPAFNIETALFACDPICFLHALASGESTRGAHRMDEIAVGVVMALPPYPAPPRDYQEWIGVPLYGATEDWHPCEMMASEKMGEAQTAEQRQPKGETNQGNPDYCSAGGYLGVATGTGPTVRKAAHGAYRVLDGISMPATPFWRNDIGRRLARDLPRLQRHGFARGIEY